jgi:pyruvate ferredoxin oxidoreductase delta subunit
MSNIKIDETISWRDITPGGDIVAKGNSVEFKTGDWRTMRPVFKEDKCKQCMLCCPTCPDMSIPVEDGKRLDFNFDHCKGCGICAAVCPFDAIEMVKEEK